MDLSSRRFCITSDLYDDCVCFDQIIYISYSGQLLYKYGQILYLTGQYGGQIGQYIGQIYVYGQKKSVY